MEIEWNLKQKLFLKEFELFMNNKNRNVYLLTGAAGTGKTFVLQEAIKDIPNVIGATVSHAAKNILQDSLGERTRCYTIAQLLGLKMDYTEDGEIVFVTNKKSKKKLPIDFAEVLIIDECSMISTEIHNIIMNRKPYDCKVIFVGDPKQLPSVGEDNDSVTFEYSGVELDQSMRFQGPIQILTNEVREQIQKLNNGYAANKYIINTITQRHNQLDDNGKGVKFLNNIHKVIDIAAYYFNNSQSTTTLRILAFKNKTISILNTAIREKLYGKNPEPFVQGELVISNGGYRENFNNGEVFRIKNIKKTKFRNIPCYSVELNESMEDPIYVINPDPNDPGNIMFKDYATDLADRAKCAAPNSKRYFWKEYWDFIQQFAKFDYAYAVNC